MWTIPNRPFPSAGDMTAPISAKLGLDQREQTTARSSERGCHFLKVTFVRPLFGMAQLVQNARRND